MSIGHLLDTCSRPNACKGEARFCPRGIYFKTCTLNNLTEGKFSQLLSVHCEQFLPHLPLTFPSAVFYDPKMEIKMRIDLLTDVWCVQCSSTCAGGSQRRVVVCQDENGYPASDCVERIKPDEQRACESGPCPKWAYGSWGEVRVKSLCTCFGKNSNFADQVVLLFIVYLKEEELAPVKVSLFWN